MSPVTASSSARFCRDGSGRSRCGTNALATTARTTAQPSAEFAFSQAAAEIAPSRIDRIRHRPACPPKPLSARTTEMPQPPQLPRPGLRPHPRVPCRSPTFLLPICRKLSKSFANSIHPASAAALCANASSPSCAITSNNSPNTRTAKKNGDRAGEKPGNGTAQVLQDAIAIVDQHLGAVQNKQHKEISKAIAIRTNQVQARATTHTHTHTTEFPPGQLLDAWFYDRARFQPLQQVGAIMEANALDAEAGAEAVNVEDLVERLEGSGRPVRIDPGWPAAAIFRGTMLSGSELEALRQIADVVRLGRVRRIEPGRIVLERGESRTASDVLHVDCTALGQNPAPARPIFQPGRIVLQQARHLSPSFNASLVGFVEAHRDTDEDKNRLCPANPYPSSIEDWPGMVSRTWRAEGRWSREPDVAAWVAQSRRRPNVRFPITSTSPQCRRRSSAISHTSRRQSSG